MTIRNVRELVIASDAGEGHTGFWHKTTLPVIGTGTLSDYSMGAGTPKYNAYVGSQATATVLVGSGNDGIYLGATPATGKKRYINRVLIQPPSSTGRMLCYLCDYLLFYPLIDGDDTDIQLMDNTVALSRSVSGDGVRVMLVCTTPMTANTTVTISYTNSKGVSGRTATAAIVGINATAGRIITKPTAAAGQGMPFVDLAQGDTGVRSIESVQLAGAAGGFFCAVLVKPKITMDRQDTFCSSEIQPIMHRGGVAPEVENGAYLNWVIFTASGTTPTPFRGELDLIWQ